MLTTMPNLIGGPEYTIPYRFTIACLHSIEGRFIPKSLMCDFSSMFNKIRQMFLSTPTNFLYVMSSTKTSDFHFSVMHHKPKKLFLTMLSMSKFTITIVPSSMPVALPAISAFQCHHHPHDLHWSIA